MDDVQALATGASLADVAKLQAWFSPSFPVGAFNYSHGLEWAVEAGDVRTAASLRAWIEGVLRFGSGRSDAIIVCATWRAVRSRDWSTACEISSLAAALQPTAERRMESVGQGNAFLGAVSAAWPHPVLQHFRESCPGETALPVSVGAAAAAHGLPLEPVLVAFLHAFAANLVSAGVRLVPLGQTDGLKVIAALEAAILEVTDKAVRAGIEDLGSAGILADIASMRHETQYTRLFRS
ncbi:urease accessory protein UreF [Pseudaminobacter sp. 19-2017]|uniref:Urease accessory protein UreF n=2 Tax=Pseudaminobacter soli (ex Zhang et al. 2022) TaxID=2831468 RepID=A0A942ICB3_9HYPH|nr:urease accessory protein UreF [Pseudaminobacter soli]